MSRRSKLDLIVRVRYANPLPAPPCPPKLLNIPTDPARYGKPEFTQALFDERPLPVVVDANMGLPLDLSQWDGLWSKGRIDPSLNPETEAPLDPKDAFLFEHVAANSNSNGNGIMPSTNVSWLRKTEYINPHEAVQRPTRNVHDMKPKRPAVDVSRPAQIRSIQQSFARTSEGPSLQKLRHPLKGDVTVVESFDILPDPSIWPNKYVVFRWDERPGERDKIEPDPRLDAALLRPMQADGEHFLSYYLNPTDEMAIKFKRKREPEDEGDDAQEEIDFKFVRDYETKKIEQECPNDFLLVLDDGDFERPKGAYYKNIERRIALKKKRQRKNEVMAVGARWDVVHLSHVPLDEDEAAERAEVSAEIEDPEHWLKLIKREMGDADADAEGEVDESAVPTEVEVGIGKPGDIIVDVPADSKVAVEF